MGMPSINIIFRELAKTFEQRNDNGIVALVLANNSGMNPKEYRPGDDLEASIAKDANIHIQFAMEGGREKPQKVICYFCQAEYADLDTVLDELDNVKFDYLTFGSALQEDQKAKVTQVLNGGLSVVVEETRVFIPASLVSDVFDKDLSKYADQEIEFVITEFNPRRRRIIGDRKQLIVAEKKKLQEELFARIAVGDVVE